MSNVDIQRERLRETLSHLLGPVVRAALDEDAVTEIMLNEDGQLWVERKGTMTAVGTMSENAAQNLLNHVATTLETQINEHQPILEGELLLHGERFIGTRRPVTRAPTFTLRKHTHSNITLQHWIDQGSMQPEQGETIKAMIHNKRNIVISGGTGSGKTTLANAMLRYKTEHDPELRLLTVEDTRELQVSNPNSVMMRTSKNFSINDCLRAALRMRPDTIVVGEVRGGECLTLLKAWNTGHPGGLCTIHASSIEGAKVRLQQMCAEAIGSVEQIQAAIDIAVDCIVQIYRTPAGERLVKDIWRRE